MDGITLTWEAALTDPAAAVALLREFEEQAEQYIVRSRTLRTWLENVPPLTGLDAPGDAGPAQDTAPGAAGPDTREGPEPRPRGDGPAGGSRDAPAPDAGQLSGTGARGTDRSAPAARAGATGDPDGIHRAPDGTTWIVPPQRRPTPPATAGGVGPVLAERVARALERIPHGRSLTAGHVAREIGHANVRSVRPVLDRMAAQGLLVKTELHPRAVVYHRTAPASPAPGPPEAPVP
ncbi:hypothetical protein [Kitasatospora sp. NPDC056731]|uniref:hypothetical protein n=1 Tax=Kitasatospora sp. NPDC056731 TaxID=3155422 RepID=UPI00341D4B09